MKKRGFTLVELLAVIVILAVIALIAVPVVLNMIEKGRIGSAEDSAYSYIKSIEDSIVTGYLSGNEYESGEYKVGDIEVNIKGSSPTNGSYELDSKNEVISGKFCINGYSIDYDGKHAKYNKDANYCTSNVITKKVCKRATVLHTEICNSKNNYCKSDGYATGATITYGNLGTKGVLESGDAFDCDVNGDEVFDPETERFYYVTDLDTDTAVLIYYNSVKNGEPNNSTTCSYNSNSSEFIGPKDAIVHLPTTTQWSNISLKNAIRNITDTYGMERVSNFSYEGYAARLLTIPELEAACDIKVGLNNSGEVSKKCKYLMENTRYSTGAQDLGKGIWLETSNIYSNYAYNITGSGRYVDYDYVTDTDTTVRPVIEVSKIDIDY